MGDFTLTGLKGRPASFGAAGVVCLVVMLTLVPGLSHSVVPVVLAVVFVVVGVAVLAAWPDRTAGPLTALWVLALALFAGYFAWDGITDGPGVTAYAAVVFGTLAFAAWAAVGFGIVTLREHARRP